MSRVLLLANRTLCNKYYYELIQDSNLKISKHVNDTKVILYSPCFGTDMAY